MISVFRRHTTGKSRLKLRSTTRQAFRTRQGACRVYEKSPARHLQPAGRHPPGCGRPVRILSRCVPPVSLRCCSWPHYSPGSGTSAGKIFVFSTLQRFLGDPSRYRLCWAHPRLPKIELQERLLPPPTRLDSFANRIHGLTPTATCCRRFAAPLESPGSPPGIVYWSLSQQSESDDPDSDRGLSLPSRSRIR